jgi:endonuclease-8
MSETALYRSAVALRTALIGTELVRIDSQLITDAFPEVGSTIEEVRSHARSIEIVWDDGMVLETQLRLLGGWHLYRQGQPWRKPEHRAHVVIEVDDWVAACFNTSSVETYRDFDPRRHPLHGTLGPDLRLPTADIEECVDRMMGYEERDETISEVLHDQRVMSGAGNVYRCEILWACEMHPWAAIGTLKRAECRELVQLAHEMLQSNHVHLAHKNAEGLVHELAVYSRQGKACHRCGDLIRVAHHGEASRVLYWCPGCQTAHQPLVRPNFTPLSIDREGMYVDQHPAAQLFMNDVLSVRGDGQDDFR